MIPRVGLLLVLLLAVRVVQGAECSPAIINEDCTITIERESPSSPLPVKVSHGAVIKIHVTKRPLDKVTFDATYVDVQTPDPISAIFSAFSPSLKNVVVNAAVFPGGRGFLRFHTDSVEIGKLTINPATDLLNELNWIDTQQFSMAALLQELKPALDNAGQHLKAFQDIPVQDWDGPHTFPTERDALVKELNDAGTKTPPVGVVNGLHEALSQAIKDYAKLSLAQPVPTQPQLDELSNKLNEVGANQAQLESSLASLQTAQATVMQAAGILKKIDQTKAFATDQVYGPNSAKVGRTATVKVTTQDTVSNSPLVLGTVSVTWGGSRWEVSTGVLFSTLANRSFQASPQIVNGQVQLDSSGKTNTSITESITRPSVVPIALAHFRFIEAARGDRRIAFLMSAGMGVEPLFWVRRLRRRSDHLLSPFHDFSTHTRWTGRAAY